MCVKQNFFHEIAISVFKIIIVALIAFPTSINNTFCVNCHFAMLTHLHALVAFSLVLDADYAEMVSITLWFCSTLLSMVVQYVVADCIRNQNAVGLSKFTFIIFYVFCFCFF